MVVAQLGAVVGRVAHPSTKLSHYPQDGKFDSGQAGWDTPEVSPRMKRLPLFLALAFSIFPNARGENAAPAERIREGEARQQQLRGEAQRLVAQLGSMLQG